MPCPLFEPQRAVSNPHHANARLPLIEEQDGVCHAAADPFAVPSELRFSCCNHGYSAKHCGHWPEAVGVSALRYSIAAHEGDVLQVICIEEKDYAPVRWRSVQYSIATGQLEPMIEDSCMRAQVIVFCRSYLQRFQLP